MCGFIGLFSDIEELHGRNIVRRSLENMNHRGPDGDGVSSYKIYDKSLILGHKRLSILDLSNSANQPMESDDKNYSIVFNGEIYNYIELRKILIKLGHNFKTKSDTEVLLNCWSRWGENSLSKINGMFAFAIFDNREKTLTLVRDGYGIKPLYFSMDSNGLYFASEINSLIDFLPSKPNVNFKRSINYLVAGIYDNNSETFYENIYSLEPGKFLKYDLKRNFKKELTQWWNPKVNLDDKMSDQESEEYFREIFLRNLKQHLRSDVQFAVTLSGGLDSSVLSYCIRSLEPDMPINTFTYVAENESFNEEKYCDIVNKDIKGIPHKVFIDKNNFVSDLENLVKTQGEPFGDLSIYSQYCVYKAVKEEGFKVTIDGQGADELIGGYYGYPEQKIKSLIYNYKYLDAIRYIKYLIKNKQFNFSNKFKTLIKSLLPNEYVDYLNILTLKYNLKNNRIFNYKEIKSLREDQFSIKKLIIKRSPKINNRYFNSYLRDQQMEFGLMPILRVLDRNSMNFSVEARVPFLSKEISEFVLSLPENKIVSPIGVTKKVLRDSFRNIIPDQIISRKDKIGFQAPNYKFIKEIREEIPYILESSADIPFINYFETKIYVEELIKNQKSYDPIIWRLINYCLWWRMHSWF